MKRNTLNGIIIIDSEEFKDSRGSFTENFNLKKFRKISKKRKINFVQDNLSISKKGVFRGLHYQINQPQGKLVQVLSGEVYDVVVDLRESSESFGDWMGIILSEQNNKQLWVPPGFAHGFLVMSEIAEFFYKVTDYWSKDDERCIKWDDEKIRIEFPDMPKSISESDQKGTSFADAEYFL